jgi:Mn-containing catalase
MPQIKELLIDQLQDLLHAETQLTGALPKIAEASHHPKLKEAFEKHLSETKGHVDRLRTVFDMLGEKARSNLARP